MKRVEYIRIIENAALEFCNSNMLEFGNFNIVNQFHPFFLNLNYLQIKEWIICHDALHYAMGQRPDACGEEILSAIQANSIETHTFDALSNSSMFKHILKPLSNNDGKKLFFDILHKDINISINKLGYLTLVCLGY